MLNTKDFLMVAGDPRAWDLEMLQRCHKNHRLLNGGGASLTEVQVDQHERGRRSAELIRGIKGWYVRYSSGLDEFGILAEVGSDVDGTIEDAIFWSMKWVMGDYVNREVFVCKQLLRDFIHELPSGNFSL